MVALFALALLAQVGIGIDRAPAIPAATARPHVKHLVKHPATPSPVPTASASAMPSPEPSATFAHTAAPHAHTTQARSGNLCSHAADIAIDSATQEKVDTKSGTDNSVIHVSILNRGAASQGAHARQLISVYRNEERLVRMQIPALEQGEAYAFTTKFKRSADAGTNSTTLLFQLGGENYAPRSIEDCNDRNNSFRLTF